MLTNLRIQNLAIAESLEVELGPRMNVVTGETGAGKSLLVDALSLLLGGRAQPELVRAGADEAVVEGRFVASDVDARLEELGLPAAGGELVIRRVIARAGRGKITVNGALCTLAMLARLGRGLMELAGQHEHVALLEPSEHLALLDAFAALQPTLDEYRQRFERVQQARRAREQLLANFSERARRLDELGFQLRELEALAVKVGEEAQLAAERKRLAAAEKLRAIASEVSELLTGGEAGAVDLAARAQARLGEAAALDSGFEPVVQGLRAAFAELDEASRTLARHLRGLEARPERLAELDDRLELIRRIARKHGSAPDSLPERAEWLRSEVARLEHHEVHLAQLEAELQRAEVEAVALAERLSEKRRSAAERFSREVKRELQALAMGETRFEVRLERVELGASGLERAELFIGPNPGEPVMPLARIASGGELSRVSLAIKRALAAVDSVGSYVFDEVDAGIGGAAAGAVGRMLKAVAAHRQVLCITHLAQVAAFADRHLGVRKAVRRNRTVAAIEPLVGAAEREAELARMLAGASAGQAALAHARELLEAANPPPRPRRPAGAPRLRAVAAR